MMGSDKLQLWDHQIKAIERAKDLNEFALFFSMGCGKTRTTIELLRHKYNQENRVRRTLILAPLIVTSNWRDEFLRFSKIPENEICILTGSAKERIKLVTEQKANILIMNYEGLLMEDLYGALVKWRPEILVCDESHRLKNMTAKRTKRAILLSDLAYVKYLLSGTPVLNSPLDIFAQYRILDYGKTFGKNFYAFRATYFFDKNSHMPKLKHFPLWLPKKDTFEKLNALIYGKAMRVTKEECLDLPPLIKQRILVDMAPQQAKMYDQMKRDFIAFVQNMGNTEASVAQLAITKALRLMQIVSGFIKTEDGNEISLSDTPKQKALKELLEEICVEGQAKVLVWSVFKQNYAQIRKVCEDLKLKYVEVHGDIPNQRKFEAVESFNTDSGISVLIGHPGSGGIGINLVSAGYAIFYSRNFSLEQDLQAESRNHRSGSERHSKITRIDLVCKDTIDQMVQDALANKISISEKMLAKFAQSM